jgi:anti-sigma regulatory factor (Ser/Thr protein kinase)
MNNLSFIVPGSLSEIENIRKHVADFATISGVSEDNFIELELTIVELFTNIVKYAYEVEEGAVEILLSTKSNQLSVQLMDSGVEYLPSMFQTIMPAISNNIDKIAEHGYGIPLVVSIVNSIKYERLENLNITTIVLSLK